MKYIITILLFLIVYSCGIIPEPNIKGWCYLRAGLYLIYGDGQQTNDLFKQEKHNWNKVGFVSEVFDFYNKDPNLEIWYDSTPTVDEINEFIIDGYRIVIIYKVNETTNHSMPWRGGDIPKSTFGYWVSGHFNEVDQIVPLATRT